MTSVPHPLSRRSRRLLGVALPAGLLLAGCTVGPNYQRPVSPISTSFKEAQGWIPSHPADAIDKGAWWSMFDDAVLDGLERQVATSNQTLKADEAAYRQAHQIVAEARAGYFPTVAGEVEVERTRSGVSSSSTGTAATATTGATGSTTGTTSSTTSGSVTKGSSTAPYSTYIGALEASWVPDLWGKVRRTVESDKALAQVSAAELANAKLAAEASLAEDYFELRVLDQEQQLYKDTVAGYQQYLQIAQNQYQEGNQPRSVVIAAETQLYGAQASLTNLGASRAQMEHAIAVLMGKPPADFSLAPAPVTRVVPVAPAGLPSTLLERRPDIAAAERQMASANALIGVAQAAFYPDLTLSGEAGTGAAALSSLFTSAGTLWSVGADVSETLLDFGLRRAQVRAARAVYDEDVATYRQTVLTAFQNVEDELANLRVYQQEEDQLVRTENASKEAVQLDLNEYQEGTVDYNTVITAQATQLTASQNVLNILQERLQASVLLVEDLGGGWSSADLPKT